MPDIVHEHDTNESIDWVFSMKCNEWGTLGTEQIYLWLIMPEAIFKNSCQHETRKYMLEPLSTWTISWILFSLLICY